MLLANNEFNDRIRAYKYGDGWCPVCGHKLIAKCGEIMIHHWAHKTKCTILWNLETEWHLSWKDLAELNGCEIEKSFYTRVADATKRHDIYEFQHSDIQVEELVERSEFYNQKRYVVNWIFDVSSKFNKGHIEFWYKPEYNMYFIKTKWVNKKLHKLFKPYYIKNEKKTRSKYGDVFLDIGIKKPLFNLRSLYENGYGSGVFVQRNGMFQPFYHVFNDKNINENYDLIDGSLFCELHY